jgi:hypothetical protein
MTIEQTIDRNPRLKRIDNFGKAMGLILPWSLVVGVVGLGVKGSAVCLEHASNRNVVKDTVLSEASSILNRVGSRMVEVGVAGAVASGMGIARAMHDFNATLEKAHARQEAMTQ